MIYDIDFQEINVFLVLPLVTKMKIARLAQKPPVFHVNGPSSTTQKTKHVLRNALMASGVSKTSLIKNVESAYPSVKNALTLKFVKSAN